MHDEPSPELVLSPRTVHTQTPGTHPVRRSAAESGANRHIDDIFRPTSTIRRLLAGSTLKAGSPRPVAGERHAGCPMSEVTQ
jgi:hypothetical protein